MHLTACFINWIQRFSIYHSALFYLLFRTQEKKELTSYGRFIPSDCWSEVFIKRYERLNKIWRTGKGIATDKSGVKFLIEVCEEGIYSCIWREREAGGRNWRTFPTRSNFVYFNVSHLTRSNRRSVCATFLTVIQYIYRRNLYFFRWPTLFTSSLYPFYHFIKSNKNWTSLMNEIRRYCVTKPIVVSLFQITIYRSR